MQLGCYSVEKHRDCWTISVDGAKLLICSNKKIAVKTVRRATFALRDDLSDISRKDWRYRSQGHSVQRDRGSELVWSDLEAGPNDQSAEIK
jgi:hypothetical protein